MLSVVDHDRPVAPATLAAPGAPWGRLELTPLLIAPTRERVTQYLSEAQLRPWRFPGPSPVDAGRQLLALGVATDTVTRLCQSARVDLARGVTWLTPTLDDLQELPNATRARLYAWLAATDIDSLPGHAFRFRGASLEEWFDGAAVRPEVVERMRPLVYGLGDYLFFADLPLLVPHLESQAELFSVVQALTRERTMLAQLHVQRGDNVDQLAEYWGRGGRQSEVRPLLESLACLPRGQSVDIVHLLPGFARRLLFTYPQPRNDGRDDLRNCYWTALNFFHETADDRLLDRDVVADQLRREWRVVQGPPLLGDVLVFHDDREVGHHAGVYLAAGLAFTKNGSGMGRPWAIMPLDDLRHFYWSDAPLHVRCFRRRDIA